MPFSALPPRSSGHRGRPGPHAAQAPPSPPPPPPDAPHPPASAMGACCEDDTCIVHRHHKNTAAVQAMVLDAELPASTACNCPSHATCVHSAPTHGTPEGEPSNWERLLQLLGMPRYAPHTVCDPNAHQLLHVTGMRAGAACLASQPTHGHGRPQRTANCCPWTHTVPHPTTWRLTTPRKPTPTRLPSRPTRHLSSPRVPSPPRHLTLRLGSPLWSTWPWWWLCWVPPCLC